MNDARPELEELGPPLVRRNLPQFGRAANEERVAGDGGGSQDSLTSFEIKYGLRLLCASHIDHKHATILARCVQVSISQNGRRPIRASDAVLPEDVSITSIRASDYAPAAHRKHAISADNRARRIGVNLS